jgi:hypothetical protein
LTPPANLERADGLVVLVLDEDVGAEQFVQGGVSVERRWAQMARYPVTRLQYLNKRWHLPLHSYARP